MVQSAPGMARCRCRVKLLDHAQGGQHIVQPAIRPATRRNAVAEVGKLGAARSGPRRDIPRWSSPAGPSPAASGRRSAAPPRSCRPARRSRACRPGRRSRSRTGSSTRCNWRAARRPGPSAVCSKRKPLSSTGMFQKNVPTMPRTSAKSPRNQRARSIRWTPWSISSPPPGDLRGRPAIRGRSRAGRRARSGRG